MARLATCHTLFLFQVSCCTLIFLSWLAVAGVTMCNLGGVKSVAKRVPSATRLHWQQDQEKRSSAGGVWLDLKKAAMLCLAHTLLEPERIA